MDFKTEANIIRARGKIIGNGHLHKGAKPVHWCVDGRSAVAEAELSITTKLLRPSTLLFRWSIRMHCKQNLP
ncbi:class I tRNA ligase family protein [Escherichia coli]